MATSGATRAPYINRDRATGSPYLDLVTCSLCQGILWLPKACQNCETPYCSSCIKNRQAEASQPIQCPNSCSEFVEHRCPQAILQILGRLELKCRNTPYECNQILPYNSLETHEEACGYRQKTCSGCGNDFSKINFDSHFGECPLVSLTCPECGADYPRQDQSEHTEVRCVRIQIRALKIRIDRLELAGNINYSDMQIPDISEVNE